MTQRFLALLLCSLLVPAAFAERADRDKPMLLEAASLSVDDARKINILEGDVVITKGTLVIRAERVVITEDMYGFQRGVAHAGKGRLATLRQKREGRDDYIEAHAERIEYDTRTEVAELFRQAWLKSGADELRGDYIWYDAISERFRASATPSGPSGATGSRVRAILQPRHQPGNTPPASPAEPLPDLRSATTLPATKSP